MAQGAAPDARVVYVDNDPLVLAHAHTLLVGGDEGATADIGADLRQPQVVLEGAAETLDMKRPVALTLVAILHLIPEDEDPYGIVRTFVDALPSGSHIALSHGAIDIGPDEMGEVADKLTQSGQQTFVWRTRDQVNRFVGGLELVDPGLVSVERWRPEGATAGDPGRTIPFYGAVARKP